MLRIRELNDKKIVFLGDCITHDGGYCNFTEAYIVRNFLTECNAEFINLGLNAETVSGLSEEKRLAISHFDYGGEKWYLVIPRYGDENELVQNGDKEHLKYLDGRVPYIINCNADVEITLQIYGGHTIVLDTDENGRLICTPDIWDITEYKE